MVRGERWRLDFLKAVIILSLLILGARLWQIQIVRGETYRVLADRNRLRLVQTEALRGVIYDRWGRVLARNTPSYSVVIIPADLPRDEAQREEVLARVSHLLFPTPGKGPGRFYPPEVAPDLKALVEEGMKNPYKPVVVKRQVTRETAFIIQEEHLNLPGVQVKIEPVREYVSSTLFSHIIGYVGPIPREKVKYYTAKGYEPSEDKVGLTGLEFTFESYLKGQKGYKLVEVDVAGREVRTISQAKPPVPGYNLHLTLDMDLQAEVKAALEEGMKRAGSKSGVAIVMDPRNGQILAMVSLPTYDNNLFARGISAEEYRRLQEDPHHPLVNHAITGQYPPGSTFKIVPAVAALEEGIVNEHTLIRCDGVLWVPNRYFPDDPSMAQPFYCWIHKLGKGHGPINIVDAIVHSCDIFFYVIAGGYNDFQGLGLKTLTHYARLFGFGEKTGIDLPGESPGLVPSARWKRLNYAENWVTGDTYNIAIGQGFLLATPLQVLNALAVIANGGTLYKPQLVYEIVDAEGRVVREFEPQVIRKIPISEKTLALVRQGLREAVTRGTAWRTNWPDIPVAGKTGTAEYPGPRDSKGNLPTHAWFAAFAPYDDPKIALVVFLEGGGEGSEMAVPVAARIIRYYFDYIAWE
ncbi:MAG: penicillin-binding protein 2 [Chloroflexi bacterium]|nr:MAG: penicillin-binding protein 2 [Chloroflexota bacterium]HDN79450.1 penicillin-binding protein 2 [Chloroflexota bacterium]